MKINQIATILNTVINQEQIGESAVVNEDLSNIVDIGEKVLDFTSVSSANFDSFIGKLIDQVGRMVFVDRTYISNAPDILKDSWEYGSILMKVRAELPDAADNASWTLKDLANGSTIDPFVISKPDVSAKFYNSKTTFEVPITIAEIQLKEAFRGASEMNRFIAMIMNRIQMKITLSTDALIQRTINNLMATKIHNKNNVVNLLEEYNGTTGTLTAAEAVRNPEFLRFASMTMLKYKDYLKSASMLYNDDGYVTFTPEDRLKFVMLSDFSKALGTYLYSDTYHNEFVKVNGFSEVPYWQGSGTDSSFDERSKLDVSVLANGEKVNVAQTGVVGVMFDEEAAAVCNENYRVTSIYNPKGEYWNYFYKYDAAFMNDTAENCVVFVIADKEAA